jgi:hypothetical protein
MAVVVLANTRGHKVILGILIAFMNPARHLSSKDFIRCCPALTCMGSMSIPTMFMPRRRPTSSKLATPEKGTSTVSPALATESKMASHIDVDVWQAFKALVLPVLQIFVAAGVWRTVSTPCFNPWWVNPGA